MDAQPLTGKTFLITGAARRPGRLFALACAHAGADIVIHHGHSESDAATLRDEITGLGQRAWIFQADLSDSSQAAGLIPLVNKSTPLHGLVNCAAIFEHDTIDTLSADAVQRHIEINALTPVLLAREFAEALPEDARGVVVNFLDFKLANPYPDHFSYTLSKYALAGATESPASRSRA